MTVDVAVLGEKEYTVPLCGTIEWMKTIGAISKSNLYTLKTLNLIDGQIYFGEYDDAIKDLENSFELMGVDPSTMMKLITILKQAKEEKAEMVVFC